MEGNVSNKLIFTKQYVQVICSKNDDATQDALAEFYPVHANRSRTIFTLSPHYIIEALKVFRGIDQSNIHTAPPKVQEYFYKEFMLRDNVADLLKNGPKETCVVSNKLTLRTHQQLGRELARYYDRFAFFYDTRTGKTPLSLAIINDDVVKNPTHKWLIICPLILIYNAWLEDAARFFPELRVVNCHATKAADRLKAISTPGNVYITNTESFINYHQYFTDFYGVFVDESSSLKSPSSDISKLMVKFSNTIPRFYLLSGTPAPNGEWEYYVQMRCIDFYGWQPSYSQFKERYFVNLSYSQQYEKLALRPDRKEELYSKLKQNSLYVDKEDVLDTPGRTFHEVEYEMPKELMKHYRKLKNELYVDLGNDLLITVPSAAAKLNKLNQVSSGFIIDTLAIKENALFDTDKAEWYLLDKFRFEALLALLDRTGIRGEQVLVWANYKKEFEVIKSLLGDRCALVYGDASLNEKNEAIKKFKSKQIQYLIANPASANKGLTLTNCHICIYFSLNWSYELFKQSYDRIYADRSIQPKHCEYYIMIAKNTIDSILYHDILQGKSNSSYAVLNHLKSEVL